MTPASKKPAQERSLTDSQNCSFASGHRVQRTQGFQTQAETLRLYRLIATMDAKAPLPLLADQEPTWGSASTLRAIGG